MVQQRLLASAKPETSRPKSSSVLARCRRRSARASAPRDYAAAQRTVLSLRPGGHARRGALCRILRERQVRGNGRGAGGALPVPIEVVDRLMGGERPDPVLILCKAAGLGWPTVKAIIMARPDSNGHVEPGPRRRLRQFRAAVDGDRAARDALLAGAAGPVAERCRAWRTARHHASLVRSPAENQKARIAALARGLGLVARGREARPRLAPIVGALRRSSRNPAERSRRCSVQAA